MVRHRRGWIWCDSHRLTHVVSVGNNMSTDNRIFFSGFWTSRNLTGKQPYLSISKLLSKHVSPYLLSCLHTFNNINMTSIVKVKTEYQKCLRCIFEYNGNDGEDEINCFSLVPMIKNKDTAISIILNAYKTGKSLYCFTIPFSSLHLKMNTLKYQFVLT